MRRYSIKKKKKKHVKGYRFLLSARKYKMQLLDTELDSLKTTSKNVVHKAVDSLGNKIAHAVTKLNNDKILIQEPVAEIIIPTEKRDEILNKLRKVL